MTPTQFAAAAKPPKKMKVRLGFQGGGALGAYGGGFLQVVGSDPEIEITEASGLSAAAANFIVWKHAGGDGIQAYWDQIGSAGDQAATAMNVDSMTSVRKMAEHLDNISPFPNPFKVAQMMSCQVIAAQETYKSYLMSGFKAAGAQTPLEYLRSTISKSIDAHRLAVPHKTKLHFSTVTKIDPNGGLGIDNVIEHVHSGDKAGIDQAIGSAALHLLTEEERDKVFMIDGVAHWDGVYSGKNPNTDKFSTRSKVPILVVSVDEPIARRSLTDENIVYGGIHDDVVALAAKHTAPVYHSNLEHNPEWDVRIRTQPNSKIIGELMEIGRQDAHAYLAQMKRDHGLKHQAYADLERDRVIALG